MSSLSKGSEVCGGTSGLQSHIHHDTSCCSDCWVDMGVFGELMTLPHSVVNCFSKPFFATELFNIFSSNGGRSMSFYWYHPISVAGLESINFRVQKHTFFKPLAPQPHCWLCLV